MKFIKGSMANKLIPLVAAGFLVLVGIVVYLLKDSTDAIIRSQAQALAETVNNRVRAMRGTYTKEIVKKLEADFPGQIQAVPQAENKGEIPLPASFARLVAESVSDLGNNQTTANLVSRWNINRDKALSDQFENDGWQFLEKQQDDIRSRTMGNEAAYEEALKQHTWEPYTRIETVDGKPVFRYMAADPASDASCVSCHNDLEQRQEIQARRAQQGLKAKTFHLNEVMGALAITVPLETAGSFAIAARNKILFSFIIAAILVLVVVSLVVRRSVRGIQELTQATARVVNDADLSQKIKVTSDDEVGQLASSFNNMMDKIRGLLIGLKDSAGILNESLVNLERNATEQNQIISTQATALQETQVTAEEIKQTSSVAYEKAQGVLEYTEKAEKIGRTGEAAVDQSLNALSEIRRQVDEIADKISQLGQRTVQVGDITQTVKDLADQSNMLALNAAIEAVRSGEAGRGFAVVAREIRSLADQSIQATSRVREILDDVSEAIQQAVRMSENGAQRIEGGLAEVKTSGDNLKELSAITRESSAAVRQIAAAVAQQNAGISQIFTAVTQQNKMMDTTVKQLHSTQQAVATLKDVSRRLIEGVQTFRV